MSPQVRPPSRVSIQVRRSIVSTAVITALAVALLPWSARGAITLIITQVPTFSSLSYSNSVDQTNTGNLTYTVSTNTVLTSQMTVSIVASALTYSGSNPGTTIPASNISVTAIGTPAYESGVSVGAPTAATVTGPIDTARAVLHWQFGLTVIVLPPVWSQVLTLQLTLPKRSLAGTYSSVITLTSATGP